MSLNAVTKALKKLTKDDSSSEKNLDYFCVEDSFLSKDVKVSVEGVGNITFPILYNCIEKLVEISSKAVFGKGKKTVLDTNVRDTQTIPASKLKVDINERSLAEVLKRIGVGLNINNGYALVPHLYNMLIYGPGQFFDKHRDSEKIPKMVATLVVILPSYHKGGDLVIEHNDRKHTFFGSHTPEIVKCIAFYSDCKHEITKVTEGYRIALTFNVVLKSPDVFQITKVDECLKQAVEYYFRKDNRARLIFYMNHSYSKCSLKWDLLKGSDRTRGHALFIIAKKLGLKPCLALVEHKETYEMKGPYLEDELSETSIHPYFWVGCHDKEWVPQSGFIVRDFRMSEICYTIETSELLEPYSTDKDEESYGNAPQTEERSYRRACVVLLCRKKKPQRNCQSLPNQLDEGEMSAGTSSGQTRKEVIFKEVSPGQVAHAENLTILPNVFYGHVKEASTSRMTKRDQ